MFFQCKSLTSLDLSSFNTDKANNLESMFYDCNELAYLNINNFNTSNTVNMKNMFYNCRKLVFLNLSSFNTSLVKDMTNMFRDCSKLNYLNIGNFNENNQPLIDDMFRGIPDNIIYCINDELLTPGINILLEDKNCKIKNCDYYWKENYNNIIEIRKNDINDICLYKEIKNISNNFYFSNLTNTSIYSYEISSGFEYKNKNSNLTFVEISNEHKNQLLNKFGINENENLYIFIYDSPSNDSRTATSEYNFVLFLEDGTKLNLSEIKDDFYITVNVPIRDLDLANYNYAKYFSQNGYDIYNKNSEFYHDVCIPSSLNNNDITLEDRKKDIYPNNVTLCKNICEYKDVNLEQKRIICECNLNSNKLNVNMNENNYFCIEENKENFLYYFLDNINYKILICYNLLLSFKNIIKNPAFYIIILIFVIITFFSIKFLINGFSKLRIIMNKEFPTDKKVRKLIFNNLKLFKYNNTIIKDTILSPEDLSIKKNGKKKKKKQNEKRSESFILNNNNSLKNINKNFININENIYNKENNNVKKDINNHNSYNLSPYIKALREDKRNIFEITKSYIFEKIEILHLFNSNETFKEIIICEYILSLLLDFFF